MADPDGIEERAGRSPLWRIVRRALFGLAFAMTLGVAVGGFIGMAEDGWTLSPMRALATAASVALNALFGWLLWRDLRPRPGEAPPTPRERRNRNTLILCGVLGGIVGALMMIAGGDAARDSLFAAAPLPAWAALTVIALIGVVLPIMAVIWHRNTDEQEADAYKSGALWGIYLYMIGAPVWWFGWRGGFLPEPDGTLIYLAVVSTCGAVWLWKKYR